MKRTDNQAVVAEYRYNGLGFRVGWHYDVDADGTVEGTADDPWFFFAYDEGWRMVATYRSTDSSPKEQFVHHVAGLGGYGGSSYIDAVILRDRDANTAWGSAADGTLEERLYYVQNWRADVVAIVTDTGGMVEWVKYSAYGVPFALPAGDTDSDGDFDATDVSAITGGGGGYDVRKDVELDGDVDAFDILAAAAITGGYQMLGRDTLSSPAVNSRRGYAGYEYAPEFAGVDRHLYHVRHRVYDAEAGRWTRRDPLGYVDGVGLYDYVQSSPLRLADPYGGSAAGAGAMPRCHPFPVSPGWGILILLTQCESDLEWCRNNHPQVQEAMANLRNCPDVSVKCCIGGSSQWAGEFNCETRSICVFANVSLSQEDRCQTLAHELWHAADDCANGGCGFPLLPGADWCEKRACAEVRAANFSGECCKKTGKRRLPNESYCQCVHRQAAKSTERAPDCSGWADVFEVWLACFRSDASPCKAEAAKCKDDPRR